MAQTGRPTKYTPEMDEALKAAADSGALGACTVNEVAKVLEVSAQTIYEWIGKHKSFSEAFAYARRTADRQIESALFKKAKGFDFTETTKTTREGGGKEGDSLTQVTESVKHVYVPPDTPAAIFWLKNRDPERWSDKTKVEVTGDFADQVEAYLASQRKDA